MTGFWTVSDGLGACDRGRPRSAAFDRRPIFEADALDPESPVPAIAKGRGVLPLLVLPTGLSTLALELGREGGRALTPEEKSGFQLEGWDLTATRSGPPHRRDGTA